MKIIVLIVLCCAGCKKPKDPYLFSIPDKNKPVLLSYGEKPDSPMSSFSDKDTWGPVLTEVDSRICLGSIGQNFKAREWGPYFGACFEKSDDSKSLLTDSISILNSKDLPKIRPEGNLLLRNNPVHLDFETAREIENEIEDSGKKRFFIGDPVLFAYFSKKPYFVHEDSFSTIGDTAKHIETSFAAYYFSFVVLNGKVRLIFPPGNLETSVTDIRYLVLDLSGAEIVSQFESFLDEIENKNREFSEECSIGKIRLTEILNESSSPTGRFLEFRNESTDHSTCLKNVLINSSKDSYPAYFTSGFIFPGATKLIVDSGSRLPGTIVKNLKWTELKARSKIRILNLQNEEEWILPDSLIFKSGNVFFSLKKNPDSGCSMSSILYSTGLAICADPGIDLSAESILTGSVCPSEKFSLTELNPIGLLVNGEIEKSGKFMELKYSGKEDCDLSGNTIRLGEAQIPFFKKGMILKEGDHLVLGDEKYFPGIRNILPVNLDFLKAESRIDIADNVKNNLLFPGIPVTDHFILESPQHEIYSLRFKRGHSGHHMRYISSFIRSDLSKNHYMSPGEADPDLRENVTGKINEISWMGSYQNGVSKPGDKFLEIVSMGTGGLSIRTEISGISHFFHFPVTSENRFTVIAKENLTCFPQAPVWKNDQFNLSDSAAKIVLLDQFSGNALDEILYDPGRGDGISSSSPKLRRSYSYTGFLNLWKNSRGNKGHIFTLPSCSAETNQSPGEDNDFEPGLFTDNGFNFPLAYNILSSVFQPDGNLGVTQYSISPPFAFHFSIGLSLSDRFRLIFLSPDPVFTANSLVYQSIENSSDLKLFNRDGIFIQAISPNPSNSQNEWVMLCNRGNDPQDLSQYELEDSSSTDIFATYKERKGNDLPTGLEPVFFSGDISVLNPGQCAFIVDPDSDQLHLRQTGSGISPVLTVKNGSTIGNGLGTEESIDLFKYVNGERIHIHSYGNRYSHSPFSINAGKNEIIFLKPGKRGEEPADYESLLW